MNVSICSRPEKGGTKLEQIGHPRQVSDYFFSICMKTGVLMANHHLMEKHFVRFTEMQIFSPRAKILHSIKLLFGGKAAICHFSLPSRPVLN